MRIAGLRIVLTLLALSNVACSDESVPPNDDGSESIAGRAGNSGSMNTGGSIATASGGSAGKAASEGGTPGSNGGTDAKAGAAGASDPETPPRPLNVTADKKRHEHRFTPSQADTEVNTSTTFSNGEQVALVDPRSPKMLGKLVVTLGGVGSDRGFVGSVGSFCVERGFHVFAVTYFSSYNIVRNDPDFYGDARLEAFEGIDHTSKYEFATSQISEPDSIERRVAKGLKYLDELANEEDWGYFLNDDGTVRWSDVIITGFSHGASSAARIAKVRRLHRAVSLAGPRDNTCGNDLQCKTGTIASWFSEESATPLDRYFALTGVEDGQHTEHLVAMAKLNYPGQPVDVDNSAPPFADSHRLFTSSDGHSEFCGKPQYEAACNYMFGVPAENEAGIP